MEHQTTGNRLIMLTSIMQKLFKIQLQIFNNIKFQKFKSANDIEYIN